MTLPVNYPLDEVYLSEGTTSIGATPVAAQVVAPCNGYVARCYAAAAGTTTGTITVAVAVNGGSDICNSTLTIAAGSNARNNPGVVLPLMGAGSTSGVTVNEGDVVTFTPSGGGGSSIGGAFCLVIRKDN